jgi:hypothetical protein
MIPDVDLADLDSVREWIDSLPHEAQRNLFAVLVFHAEDAARWRDIQFQLEGDIPDDEYDSLC